MTGRRAPAQALRRVGVLCLAAAFGTAPAWPARAAGPATGPTDPGAAVAVAEAVQAAGPAARRQPATPAPLPISVTITRMEPREVRPDLPTQVVATLTNSGSTTLGPFRVRLQRGQLLTTRSELATTDTQLPDVTTRFAPSTPVDAVLAPGQSRQVTYQPTQAGFDLLRLTGLGVYPVAFTVADAQSGAPVGRADTLLPSFVGVDPQPTQVAWLWPLLDSPHRLTGDTRTPPVFTDDGLARSVSPGGRLDRLLAIAEGVTGRVRLTLVVDPETIDALRLMTKDYRYGPVSNPRPGQRQRAVAAWLARLRRIAPQHLVVAVPYGDPDLVALDRGQLGDPLKLRNATADVALVDSMLGVAATSALVWPAGGVLTDAVLDDVVQRGAKAVVLDAPALPGGVSRQTPTASAVSPLPALGGRAFALVTDATLQSLISHPAGLPGGPRVAEQRYLAELAMITAEEPAVPRTLVIAPPRRWTATTGYTAAVLADTATSRTRWLASLTADAAVQSTPPADRGPLVYPPGAAAAELPPDLVGTIREVQGLVEDFRTALTNEDAGQVLSGYPEALLRATSSAWRGTAAGAGREYVNALREQIERIREQVRIQPPISGVYTLASSNSPLTVTVVNQLSVPVKVRVRIITKGTIGFRTQDVGVQDIPATSRSTVRVPAEVQRAGTFSIGLQLTSPGAKVLGGDRPIDLTVRSTAYGTLALGITGVALGVLVLALVVRLIRRLRSGGGAPVTPAGSPAERSAW